MPPALSVDDAADALLRELQTIAATAPDRLQGLAKDLGVLVKVLRNPADTPTEPKFQKVKLANPTIARVLANVGVRGVLESCGFAEDAAAEHLALSTVDVAVLRRAAERVEAAHQLMLELQQCHAARSVVPAMAALPWSIDGAAQALVQACLRGLASGPAHASIGVAHRATWVHRLHHVLYADEMHQCRALLLAKGMRSAAVHVMKPLVLELLRDGGHDLQALVRANQVLARLVPPGEPATLAARLDFCFACLEAALPHGDELLELRLKLRKDDLLGSTIGALGAFSEMGVRCGILKQQLTIEYAGEGGADAGGLRRQFFDRFTQALTTSPLWTLTPIGNLCPVDARATVDDEASDAEARRLRAVQMQHWVTCGRVCGMALYQEVHRRLAMHADAQQMLLMAQMPQPTPNLLGHAFAHHLVRLLMHEPPSSLRELQHELAAECLEADPDYRAGEAILSRGVAESGLDGTTFVRTVQLVPLAAGSSGSSGDGKGGGRGGGGLGPAVREVPLVEGGESKAVTDENKLEWLERLLRSELVDGCAEAARHMRRGFLDVVGRPNVDADLPELSKWTTPHLCMLSPSELQTTWSGAPVGRACIAELRRVAEVHPEVAEQAEWLWQVLDELSDEQRARYLRFVTGSSRRPSSGFTTFRIGPKAGGDGAYPFAHTCANALDMPSYSAAGVLGARLAAAVDQAHDSFTDL